MTRGRTNPARDRANANGRRPKPPARLTDAEAAIWTATCASQSGEWCEVASVGTALAMYCVARAYYEAILARMHAEVAEAVDAADAITVAGRYHKTLADLEPRVISLETKLRLTHQANIRPDVGPRGAPKNPWDVPDDDEGTG
jgi:hypothetical protein